MQTADADEYLPAIIPHRAHWRVKNYVYLILCTSRHVTCLQNADFLYMTGVGQSGLLAAIKASPGGSSTTYTLFVPPATPERDIWDGERLNAEAAVELFGAHAAFPMTEVHFFIMHDLLFSECKRRDRQKK